MYYEQLCVYKKIEALKQKPYGRVCFVCVMCMLFGMSDSFVTYAQKPYHFVALTLTLELHCTEAIILLWCAALASSHVFIS